MLDIVLRILSVLGIIFLVLLALAAVSVLLALFFPVTYRVAAGRGTDELKVTVKLRWLFGLLRAGYRYPEPGRVIVKALFFTLYDGKAPGGKGKKAIKESGEDSAKKPGPEGKEARWGDASAEKEEEPEEKAQEEEAPPAGGLPKEKKEGGAPPAENVSAASSGRTGGFGRFFRKYGKIKYTIRRICDKIKEIWENISYYAELLQEEDTKRLFADVLFRAGKVLKYIRPRHIKAEIIFGTGSPDTTGYIYGIYCMLASVLFIDRTWVTPDFENAVLKGEIEIRGHIALWGVLVNGLRIFTDKRLNGLIEKVKSGKSGAV